LKHVHLEVAFRWWPGFLLVAEVRSGAEVIDVRKFRTCSGQIQRYLLFQSLKVDGSIAWWNLKLNQSISKARNIVETVLNFWLLDWWNIINGCSRICSLHGHLLLFLLWTFNAEKMAGLCRLASLHCFLLLLGGVLAAAGGVAGSP